MTSAFEMKREAMLALGEHNERTLAEQGHITHYGYMPSTPCAGVCSINDAEWLHEDIHEGIDLAWEEHILTCPNEDHDECWAGEFVGTVLIGFVETDDEDSAWFVIRDEYESGLHVHQFYMPDPNAEYSAIVGEVYAQIVRSMWVQNCVLCSPCYPGQGSIEQDGKGDYIAYTLPPDVWGDRRPEGVYTWGNACPKCRQLFSAHNDDGSCVQD